MILSPIRSLFLFALAAAMSGMAGASTILHNVDAQAYRDEAAAYQMVGKVTGSGLSGCGVMISDRWVLTAGHVADFKAGGTYEVGGQTYTIQSAISAPGHGLFSTTYDVGLLYLSSSVPSTIAAATMLRFDNPASLLGREAVWVGNGLTGTGLDDNRGTSEMRAFTNIIDGYTPRSGLPVPSFFSDFDNPDGTSDSLASGAIPTRLEGNVTTGDSGGGVFIMVDGKPYLVGISSYTSGFAPGLNSKYGSISGAADLQQFYSWIYDQTGIAAVPEPGALWLCLLGGLVSLRRKR